MPFPGCFIWILVIEPSFQREIDAVYRVKLKNRLKLSKGADAGLEKACG